MVAAIGLASAAVGAYGATKSAKANKQAAEAGTTQQQQVDPRIEAMLFGDGTAANKGLLSQYQGYLNQGPGAGVTAAGNNAQSYLQNNAAANTGALQSAATGMLNSQIGAPQSQAAQSQAAQSQAAQSQAAQSQAAMYNGTPSATAAQMAMPQQFAGANMVSAQSQGAQINAPAQNGIDLTGAYNGFINGSSAENPYLTKQLQAGVDLTNASYQKNAGAATDSLNSALSGIRGNSVLAGQYGSSRQGVAEGNALKSYTDQLTNANLQLGLANSANVAGAQAQTFNQGQDRALAATQGLGAQQYGVASQNAALQQQNNISNAQLQNQTGLQVSGNEQQAILAYQNALNNANSQNAGYQQQTNLSNQALQQQTGLLNTANQQQANLANQSAQQQSGLANQSALQQNNQFNAGMQQQTGQFNAGQQQQNNQFNAGMQSGTNSLNSQNQMAGMAGLSGLLQSQYGYAQNQDNYGINRASQVNGLLTPYLSTNGSTTVTQPYASNTGANILGGATAGLGLFNGIRNTGAFGSWGNTTPNAQNITPGTY